MVKLNVAVYRGSIHAIPNATGRHTGGIGQPASGVGPAPHPGVVELGIAEGVEFAPAADGSGDLANVEPVRVQVGEHGGPAVEVGGYAVFARLHEPDAPLAAAPIVPVVRVEGGVHEFAAGAFVLPAAASAE